MSLCQTVQHGGCDYIRSCFQVNHSCQGEESHASGQSKQVGIEVWSLLPAIIFFVLLPMSHRFVRLTGRHARINIAHLLAARGPASLAPGSLGCHWSLRSISAFMMESSAARGSDSLQTAQRFPVVFENTSFNLNTNIFV